MWSALFSLNPNHGAAWAGAGVRLELVKRNTGKE